MIDVYKKDEWMVLYSFWNSEVIATKDKRSNAFALTNDVCGYLRKNFSGNNQQPTTWWWCLSCHRFLRLGHIFHRCTMLQKLSKCEVKAWLCWNLTISPPLRFYVKSNWCKLKGSINVIFGNFRDSELWILSNLGLESHSNLLKIKIQKSKIAKSDRFNTPKFDFT